MQNDVFNIKKHHIRAAEEIHGELSEKIGKGKSTLAYLLGRKLKMEGIKTKILDLSDFYSVPPIERRAYREKNGIESVGVEEYNWEKIESTIIKFKKGQKETLPLVDLLTDQVDEITTNFKDVQVLIISGLYAFYCKHVDYKIFMELTYRETYEAQEYTGKEVMDSFRRKILETEHIAVQKQKNDADVYIDFNSYLDSYHL